jgi:hypothetical protein
LPAQSLPLLQFQHAYDNKLPWFTWYGFEKRKIKIVE